MALNVQAYLDQLQALLPPGPAWTREPDAQLTKVLRAWAAELANVDLRADDIINEADPRTTLELLPDWERVAGLPDICAGPAVTLQQRRERLVQRLVDVGGQSPLFFIGLAARLGFTITITEFPRFTCNSECDDPLNTDPWCFAWQVNAPAETIRDMTCNSGCDEPIRTWGNQILECVIGRVKPAHTTVLFAYG